MRIRESFIERKVKVWAKRQGIIAVKMSPVGVAGYPDDLFLFRGQCAFIEFKAEGEKPRPLQEYHIANLKQRGFPVAVVETYEHGREFLTQTFGLGAT